MNKQEKFEGRKNFFSVSPRSSNGLQILKNTLELEQ